MKKIISVLLLICICLAVSGCGDVVIESANGTVDGMSAVPISLNGDSAKVGGGGASSSGSVVTISASGFYSLSGELSDGQIIIDTGDDAGLVTLILNGAGIANSADAAIFVRQAKDVTFYLAEKTVNTVRSGSEADLESFDEASASGAAINAEDDIDFAGSGTLNVFGYLNNGVSCKNDIDIEGGVIYVFAANNGVRGSDSVEIKGGVLSVEAGNDGVKATEAEKDGKGYVSVSGGEIIVRAAGDGISAEKELSISGGVLSISSGEENSLGSGKGIKAQTALTISGGELSIMAVDHAIHCDGGITVSGGVVAANSTTAKGMDANGNIEFTGGSVAVASAKDGIASEADISISGGTVSAISGDDGINAKGKLISRGGSMIAIGSSKRIKSFDPSSTQGFFACSISGGAGSTVEVSQGGSALWTVSPQWSYNTLIYSSNMVAAGESYTVSNGSTSVDVSA